MKTINKLAVLILVAVAGFQVTQKALANENSKYTWISAGVVATTTGGAVSLVEVERLWSDDLSVGLRFVSTSSYQYTDGSYKEKGSETGVEVTARFYPERNGFHGMYWGGGMGLLNTKYTWTDPYDIPSSGSGSKTNLNLNASLGWKIRFGEGAKFFLDPQVGIGLHTNAGIYFVGGIQAGTRF